MNKLTMGRMRKKSKAEESGRLSDPRTRSNTEDALFLLGAAAVCVMLALPMLPSERTVPREETAVMVMSGAVQVRDSQTPAEREELVTPSNTEFEEEWNFYDYIGELFAGLISGQG